MFVLVGLGRSVLRGRVLVTAPTTVTGATFTSLTSTHYKRWGLNHNNNNNNNNIRQASSLVTQVDLHPSQPMLKVEWKEGGTTIYPYLWLRDNCQCSQCYHPTTLSRLLSVSKLQPNMTPAQVKVSEGGNEIQVTWTDGHLTKYPTQWLQQQPFNTNNKQQQQQQLQHLQLPREHWGKELLKALPVTSFPELVREEEEGEGALLHLLTTLETIGLMLVKEVPKEEGQLQVLSRRVSSLLPTHYGDTFLVEDKVDANNLAYTTLTLDLHTDQPYIYDTPGVS
ncbi:hypothetical protein Pmani_035351 [Petrolisthes manimaculis]|uniref:Gamma-butyrobetaine hydroxylase-like N-terminal domain-containing protein n=1 Tax=Petrolisthes manimaculis TaxID=1843537 RepID=A0AAE1TNS9_9EUCA|nr:hypothetical protein Pmani_035351 [Petrolisthes manimaculis]